MRPLLSCPVTKNSGASLRITEGEICVAHSDKLAQMSML